MFSQYFGHYLLNRGLIQPEQLSNALEYQRTAHLKLGVIAINAGFMSPMQVEEIHNMQKRVDKRFGEIAIELGYINEEQLNQMLSTQKQGHLLLGQALIDLKYFTMDELQGALEGYKKESGLSNRQFNVILNNDKQEIESAFSSMGEKELCGVYSDYVTLFVKNVIRFIDDNPTVEINKFDQKAKSEWCAHQRITGISSLNTAIACSAPVFIKLAGKFAQEELTEVDELAQASVGEFLNLHNGIFLVNMSNNGVELDMNPQTVEKDYIFTGDGKAYVITCHMMWGDFDLFIG